LKAVFVVSGGGGRQRTCLAVSSACVRLLERCQAQHPAMLAAYVARGQAKVVLRAPTASDQAAGGNAAIMALAKQADALALPAVLVVPQQEGVETLPHCLAILGPVEIVDRITGHLKLL
jgi:peptidyl-tRNA hydrolase